jgi:hypothetical protein
MSYIRTNRLRALGGVTGETFAIFVRRACDRRDRAGLRSDAMVRFLTTGHAATRADRLSQEESRVHLMSRSAAE